GPLSDKLTLERWLQPLSLGLNLLPVLADSALLTTLAWMLLRHFVERRGTKCMARPAQVLLTFLLAYALLNILLLEYNYLFGPSLYHDLLSWVRETVMYRRGMGFGLFELIIMSFGILTSLAIFL